MYVIYERIDDDQERTQIDMILCFDNEDFANKHVPKLAISNETGGKKAGREIGRQFQTNLA